MEEDFFLQPAVAAKLKKNFVEARLHTDSPADYPLLPRIQEVQEKLAKIPANPVYVVVDPHTEETRGYVAGAKKGEFMKLLELVP